MVLYSSLKTKHTAIFLIVQWDFEKSNAYIIKIYKDSLFSVTKAPNISSVCVCTQSFSHVQLFATLGTVACQAPLSIEFSK